MASPGLPGALKRFPDLLKYSCKNPSNTPPPVPSVVVIAVSDDFADASIYSSHRSTSSANLFVGANNV